MIEAKAEYGITNALLEVGLSLAKTLGITMPFEIRAAIAEKIANGGPCEFIGALAIDPKTGQTFFSVTSIRFYANRIPEDVPVRDIAEAYFLAGQGNQRALESIGALKEKNLEFFKRSLRNAKGYQDESPEPRYFSF